LTLPTREKTFGHRERLTAQPLQAEAFKKAQCSTRCHRWTQKWQNKDLSVFGHVI